MATTTLEGKIALSTRGATGARIALAIGACLMILALAALGYELVLALQTGSYRPLAAGELWYALDRGSLNLVQAVIQRYVHPALWDPVLAGLLQWPAWSLLGAPGAALLIVFAPRRAARGGA